MYVSKEYNIFGRIAYLFRVGQLGLSGKQCAFKRTLSWKRKDNASKRKAKKEIDKAF